MKTADIVGMSVLIFVVGIFVGMLTYELVLKQRIRVELIKNNSAKYVHVLPTSPKTLFVVVNQSNEFRHVKSLN